MMKTLITMLLAIFLLFGAIVFEQKVTNNTFNEFYHLTCITQEKLSKENPSVCDGDGLFYFWLENKKKLQVWIPHAEIKEIDLWVSECVAYTKLGKFDEASAKLDVLKTLSKQIPRTFSFYIENLF